MKFPYQQYTVTPTPQFPDGVVHRPEVPVLIEGPLGTITVFALLDTGADETVLPQSIADDLGIQTTEGATSKASGFTGHQLDITHSDVDMAFVQEDGELLYHFTTTVGFCAFPNPEAEVVILGHAGCLESMRVVFDGGQHQVEIEAHW